MEQKYHDAIKKIVQLTKQDSEFDKELRKALGISTSEVKSEDVNSDVKEIEWSLLSFSSNFDDVFLNSYINKVTGEPFKVLTMVNKDFPKGDRRRYTNVYLSKTLKEISMKEIESRLDSLKVILLDTGRYKLCEVTEKGNRNTLRKKEKRY